MSAKKTLRVGLLGEVEDFDPRRPQEFSALQVLLQVFETPYSAPLEGRPSAPQLLAEPLRQESSPGGGTVLAAPLLPDVLFSDGTPLTAEQVVRSYRDCLPEGASVRARGDEIVLTLERPHARFQHQLVQAPYAVVLERGGRLLGTGPFALDPVASSAREIRLVRNEHYRREVPLDELVFRVYPPDADGAPTGLLEAIQQGEVDFCSVLGREDLAKLGMVRKYILPGASTAFLYFNTERPAFQEVNLRRALALGIDRRELTKVCYANSFAFVATSPLPPFMERAYDDLDPDERRARELLAEIGPPARLRLLRVWGPRPYLPDPVGVTSALEGRCRELGIELEVTVAKSVEDYFQQIARGDADLYLSGWAAETTDPSVYLDALLAQRWIPRPGRVTGCSNLSRYASDEMETALDRYRQGDHPDAAEVIGLVTRDVPFLPIMYGAAVYVHSFDVRNFAPSPLGWTLLGGVDKSG
jgi:ABC-type transport system substrate-binding protein